MSRTGAVLLLLLLSAVIVSAIGVVYARQQNRILFGELTHLTMQQDELNTEFGRLELEQAT
ncbi:MAG TPA: cell division protein FtsL, partial [Rudaea sp.]|nr:cell division protein FtsL [Rudaea sp.]